MKKITVLLHITCISCLLLLSCKKGEDDPAISFRSRKARAAGDWHLTRGSIKLEEKVAGVVSSVITYDLRENSFSFSKKGGGDTTYSGDLKMTLSLTKEGEMRYSQAFNSDIYQGSGGWDFAAGIGDSKKKEVIGFRMTSSSGESYYIDLFNKSSTYFTYRIRELRDKQLVLECEKEMVDKRKDGTSYYVSSMYSFDQ